MTEQSHSQYPAVLLFGAPGVGKGTQGRLLSENPGLLHVSSGDIFRNLDADSADAKKVTALTKRGELVPDELTLHVFKEAIQQKIDDGSYTPDSELLVLDGIPRTVGQAAALDNVVDVLMVISFLCTDQEAMIQRIQKRSEQEDRTDDGDVATIRRRFEIYHKTTKPVLDCYPDELIQNIDPQRPPEEVLQELLGCITPILPARS